MLNPLLKCVATSKTIEIHSLTKAMEARGETVVSLCVGEPDFPPPQRTSCHHASMSDPIRACMRRLGFGALTSKGCGFL